MNIELSEKYLPVYEALASNVRIQIIHLLSEKSMNIKELAEALGLSSAIMTMHIRKLEKAGIVVSEMTPGKGGAPQKVCSLDVDHIEILFPEKQAIPLDNYRFDVSIGHYTDIQAYPTCGICTKDKIIGVFDDPRYFLDPDRLQAKIFWFGHGHVEYKVPIFLERGELPMELDITMELSSEAPHTNNDWPSDITFFLNGVNVGSWTSPGDFGDKRGKLNPGWWLSSLNQFGLLKRLSINHDGTFMDGIRISDVTLDDVQVKNGLLTLRIAVLEESKNVGGLTLFGSGFGNYNQDIIIKLYYTH